MLINLGDVGRSENPEKTKDWLESSGCKTAALPDGRLVLLHPHAGVALTLGRTIISWIIYSPNQTQGKIVPLACSSQ
jgi:hypothetical protein